MITARDTTRDLRRRVQTALRSHGTCAGLARIDGHVSGYKRGKIDGERVGQHAITLLDLYRKATS